MEEVEVHIQSGASGCEKGVVKFPLLALAAQEQLQYSPMACGTLGKHFTQPDARAPPRL